MRDAWLGRLFVRFREKRDGRALAAVFDATARELIGVAAHLVPTADLAEDVVQSTFQRAIEHAERFDAGRSLKGWLYGILVREAAKLTRSELRAPERGALAARETVAPEDEVARGELPESVRRALARVPSPYREVLEPALLEERGTREIAARLDRSPGTVRVQLQRGLERLRRELPGATRELAGRRAFGALGLAPLRARVLANAKVAGAAVPAASAAFLLAELASVALPAKAWAGAAVVAVAVTAGTARLARPTGAPHADDGELRAATLLAPPAPLATPVAIAGVEEAEPRDAAEPAAAAPSSREPRASTRPPPLPVPDPQVTGVVLDDARRALAGVVVIAEAENHYGYAETVTDEQGRFAFGDLAAQRWYFHVEDERHARMWWQTHGVGIEEDDGEVLEAELELVLRAPPALRGTLVDPGGAPVAGAMVTLVGERPKETGEQVQDNLSHDLASATTDAEGAFVFERLGAGAWWAVLAHPDFAQALVQLDVPGEPPRLALEPGMTLEGIVLSAGAPLADVPVYAHSTRNSRRSLGDWETRTGADGRFRIEHVARALGERFPALTLRVDGEGWTSDDHAVFEAPTGTLPPVTIAAFAFGERERQGVAVGRDGTAAAQSYGPPRGSGSIRVRLADDLAATEDVALVLAGLDPELEGLHARGSVAPRGTHAFERLAPGRYRISAEARDGAGLVPEEVVLAPGEAREMALGPGALSLSGRVRSAGAPVESGWIAARSIRGGAGQEVRGTIAGGAYELRGLVPGSYELRIGGDGALTQTAEVELVATETRLDLELPAGRIEGRLDFERAGEGADFRVMVFPHGWYQESGARGVIVDPLADGRFAVRHLPPGDYAVWAWRASAHVTSPVVRVSAAAPVAEVVLERGGPVGVLTGRVGGAERGARALSIAALEHEPEGLRRTGWGQVGDDGRFRVEVEPGRYSLLVSDFSGAEPFTWLPDVVVGAGETAELDVELPESRTVVIALDAGGAWTPRATWRLRMHDGAWLPFVLFIGSETEGRRTAPRPFRLPLGRYTVEADFGDAAPVVRAFDAVAGDGVQEVRVERP